MYIWACGLTNQLIHHEIGTHWAQNGSPNLTKYVPKEMFVTKKEQPNLLEIL
jgi:hypothetical protein